MRQPGAGIAETCGATRIPEKQIQARAVCAVACGFNLDPKPFSDARRPIVRQRVGYFFEHVRFLSCVAGGACAPPGWLLCEDGQSEDWSEDDGEEDNFAGLHVSVSRLPTPDTCACAAPLSRDVLQDSSKIVFLGHLEGGLVMDCYGLA